MVYNTKYVLINSRLLVVMFLGVKSSTWIFNCVGHQHPDLCVVQGLTVFLNLFEKRTFLKGGS